jgi:hypothetical protein
MAIRRVGGSRKRRATRSANPRRRKKTVVRRHRKANPRRRKTAIRRRRKANPVRRRSTRKGMRRTTARRAYKRRRNTSGKAMFKLAGVDMGAVALGTAAAVLIKNALNNVGFINDQLKNLPDAIQPLVSPALVVGSGWAIHKYAKNPMLKKIGAYAAVAGVVLAVDDFVSKQTKDLFGGAWHNYGGNTGGAYHQFSGAYVQMPKSLSGGFGGSNIGSSMFGGITNLA